MIPYDTDQLLDVFNILTRRAFLPGSEFFTNRKYFELGPSPLEAARSTLMMELEGAGSRPFAPSTMQLWEAQCNTSWGSRCCWHCALVPAAEPGPWHQNKNVPLHEAGTMKCFSFTPRPVQEQLLGREVVAAGTWCLDPVARIQIEP